MYGLTSGHPKIDITHHLVKWAGWSAVDPSQPTKSCPPAQRARLAETAWHCMKRPYYLYVLHMCTQHGLVRPCGKLVQMFIGFELSLSNAYIPDGF